MSVKPEDLTVFVAVVENGSLNRAAQALGLSKSVLSKRLSRLENAVNARLLHRTTGGARPTDQGSVFLPRARRLLRELDEAAMALDDSGGLKGRLRITAPMSFGTQYLGAPLFRFARQHPDLALDVVYDDHQRDLLREGFDVAIRISREPGMQWHARRLCTSGRVLVASPEYVEQRGEPESIEALARHSVVHYSQVDSAAVWQFESRSGRDLPALTHRITVNNGEAARDAAEAGIALALLPRFIVQPALDRGSLVAVLCHERPTDDPVYALYPESYRGTAPRAVRALIDFLVAELAEDVDSDPRFDA